MAGVDDYRAFGDFLSQAKARTGKIFRQLEAELHIYCIHRWHRYEAFPAREMLPEVAKAYGVELEALTAEYEKAKAARETEKASKRTPRYSHIAIRDAANYDLPASGPTSRRRHSYRNSGGR